MGYGRTHVEALCRQGFQPGEVRLRSLASAVRFYERIGYERLEVWKICGDGSDGYKRYRSPDINVYKNMIIYAWIEYKT